MQRIVEEERLRAARLGVARRVATIAAQLDELLGGGLGNARRHGRAQRGEHRRLAAAGGGLHAEESQRDPVGRLGDRRAVHKGERAVQGRRHLPAL